MGVCLDSINVRKSLLEKGVILLGRYTRLKDKHYILCKNGHVTHTQLYTVLKMNKDGCSKCNRNGDLNYREVDFLLRKNNNTIIRDQNFKLPETITKGECHWLCRSCGWSWSTKRQQSKKIIMGEIGCIRCTNGYIDENEIQDLLDEQGVNVAVIGKVSNGSSCKVPLYCHDCKSVDNTRTGVFVKRYGYLCPVCHPNQKKMLTTVKGYFYYLRVTDGGSTYYKVGITRNSLNLRYKVEDREKIQQLAFIELKSIRDAYDLEQYYLKLFKDFRYQGSPILSSGNTELFTKDILQLDT